MKLSLLATFTILVIMSRLGSSTPRHENQPRLNQPTQTPTNPYTNATHAALLNLRAQLITRAMNFDNHFRKLLTESKLNLHNMFVQTYGMMYEHNTEIFANMYNELENYYLTGHVELTKSMESFFQRLYQKIFQVANSHKIFPNNFLECASEQLNHLKPFKDAPDKLIKDIKHTLVAARTFHQALNSAIDIIKSIISLGDPPQCINLINEKLLRSQQQQRPTDMNTRDLLLGTAASRDARLLPCPEFCEQVMVRCIGRANLEPLDNRWKSYVVALADLAKKLTVQYNIETSIMPIDVQISEAIMNFQENSNNITERVFALCGADTKPTNNVQALQDHSGHIGLSPARVPGHNSLGKREASPGSRISPLTAIGTSGGVGILSSQPTFSRRNPPPTPLDYERSPSASLGSSYADPNRHMMASISRNHHNQAQSSSDEIHTNQHHAAQQPGLASASLPSEDRSSSLYGPYEEMPGGGGGSPLIPFNRKSQAIIGEIKDYLLSIKNFWSSLPGSVCNISIVASSNSGQNQVNVNLMRSRGNSPQNCFHETLEVYDMNSDFRYRLEIQTQISRLDSMYSKINDALRGVEIHWPKGPPSSPTLSSSTSSPDGFPNSSPIGGHFDGQAKPKIQPVPMHPVPQTTTPDEDGEQESGYDPEPGSGEFPEESDDPEEEMPPEETEESTDEPPATTSQFDPAQETSTPLKEVDGNSIDGPSMSNSETLITAERPKSGASSNGLLIVIDNMSLLLVSIIYCALSIVTQNQFRPIIGFN